MVWPVAVAATATLLSAGGPLRAGDDEATRTVAEVLTSPMAAERFAANAAGINRGLAALRAYWAVRARVFVLLPHVFV